MPDNELRVTITADTSSLQAGMTQAQQAVQSTAAVMESSASSSQTLAQAQSAAAAATRNLAQAQRELGAAASGGNATAQAIIAQYQTEVTEASASVQQLTSSVEQEVPALAAQATAARAAGEATTYLGVSSRQAATAGIGILEGRMMSGNRAAAAFLSTTLGLGPVLQAAFPVIGALAMVEVLYDIGKAAYEAYEKFISLDAVSEKLTDDFKKMQSQDIVNVHSIETATLRLDELNNKATVLRETAQQIHDISLKDLFSDLAQGNLAGAGSDIGGLLGARSGAAASAQATLQSIQLTKEQVEQQHQLREAKIEAGHAGDAALEPEKKITAEYQKQLALHAEAQRYSREQDRAMGNAVAPDQGNELKQIQDLAAANERSAQQAALLRQYQHEAVSEMLADNARAITLQNQVTEALERTRDEFFKLDNETAEQAKRAQEETTEMWRKAHEEKIALARIESADEVKAAQAQFEATERQIKLAEQLGEISARTAAQQLLAAEQLKSQATQGALSKEGQAYDPALGGKDLEQYTQLQNKMSEEARKSALEREQITQQEASKIAAQFKKAFSVINQDFLTAVHAWQSGTETASQAFAKMFGSMVTQAEDFVIKYLLQKAEMWAMDKILEATGLAEQKGIQSAAAVAKVESDAALAAAGTMAYYSAIFPPAAPAMASAAYAETMAFGSMAAFEMGGMSMTAGPKYLHAGERVLSAGQTSNFESMVNNSSRGGNTYSPHYHAAPGESRESQQAGMGDMMKMLKRMVRPEALA